MNDTFDQTLILLIFFVAISYLNFLSLRLKNKTGWNNVTCNPIKLFSNSLFQSQEESNREFERCVVKLSTEATTQLFKTQKAEQENVLRNQTGIEDKYKDLSEQVEKYAMDISGASVEYARKANEVRESQKEANKMNDSTTNNLHGYVASIQNIFQNIKSYF